MIVSRVVIHPESIGSAGILILIVARYVTVRMSYDTAFAVIVTSIPIVVIPV